MGRVYASELRELPLTYATVVELGIERLTDLAALARDLAASECIFVGSGGTLALAELAASLHIRLNGRLASAMTPGGYAEVGRHSDAAVVIFSSRAKHPDIRVAARAAKVGRARSVTLVTQLAASEIEPSLRRAFDRFASIPRTTADGFLATNGLLAMATSWALANEEQLPAKLPSFADSLVPPAAPFERYVVLHGPEHSPAAADMEARLSESGLADVQVTDLRNMAHGRHVGLAARTRSTAILAMTGPASNNLLEQTLSCLGDVPTRRLHTPLLGTAGALDLMAMSAREFGALASHASRDPGQPRVGPSGRKLYHLPWKLTTPDEAVPAGVMQKLPHNGRSNGQMIGALKAAQQDWLELGSCVGIKALVLDYDGTCVTTDKRLEPPVPAVREQVLRLLNAGLSIGFASGRGKSLAKTLAEWIPLPLQGRVCVGMYNGGVIASLDAPPLTSIDCEGPLEEAADLLEPHLAPLGWALTRRPTQLTFERTPECVSPNPPLELAQTLLGHRADLHLQLLTSGHSIDVLPHHISKTAVISALGCRPDEVIAIGDQGQLGGNDFALLAAVPLSLSVDRVSLDSSRCWNLGRPTEKGPELLVRYLKAIRVNRDAFRFRWPKARVSA